MVPLNIDRDRKREYIETLEAADVGTLRCLTRLIADIERRELVRALGIGEQAEREKGGIDEIIAAAREKAIGAPATRNPVDLALARSTADALLERAGSRIDGVFGQLQRNLLGYVPQLSAQPERFPPDHPRARWHQATIIGFARRRLHYFANFDSYAAWVRLRLEDSRRGTQDDIMIAFHGVGETFRGVIGVVAFIERASREETRWERTDLELLDDDLFQINAREPLEQAEVRFDEWLEQILTTGLAIWQRGLATG